MDEKIVKHALVNAVEHGGKADRGAVLGRLVSEDASLKENIKKLIPEIAKVVDYVNTLSPEEQTSKLSSLGGMKEKKSVEGLPDLPDALLEKVVMRLAPFPSGPLHIGNARMVILNDEYVKKYNGRLLLIFDDTIGSKEKSILPEAYGLIKDGLDWLGVKYHKVIYKSDRIPIFYEHAQKMIEKGLLYVCTCSETKLRNNREKSLECSHRSHSTNENLDLWKKMLAGKVKEGMAVVRLKTVMQHPNPAFRDRVMLRISDRRHPRVGKRYRVWPTLEFSWAVDDYLLGITHVLRGKQLVIEDMVEEFIWSAMGWKKSQFVHYGMLKIKDAKLSKSESRKLIKHKKLSGWEDPRTWSLQSLEARGIQPDAVRKFVVALGLSEADIEIPMEILYAENRKIIDPIANRYFAVTKPVMIPIAGMPHLKIVSAPLHPDFPKRGMRKIPIGRKIYIDGGDSKLFGEHVGLINLFTVLFAKKSKFLSEKIEYSDQKIQWVSEPNVKVKLLMPDGSSREALAEPDIKKVKDGNIVQFYRLGFCKIKKERRSITARYGHK